jgi:hypothetical protein
MSDLPRYAFHPIERRGLLLGLSAAQLLGAATGLVAGLLLRSAIGGPAGDLVGGLLAVLAAALSLWNRGGRPVGAWAAQAALWALGRTRGAALDDLPVAGDSRRRTNAPAGLRLRSDAGLPGEAPMAVIADSRGGTVAAVIPVEGSSFALMDPGAQAQQLEAWRRVLGATARPGSPVLRIQLLHRASGSSAGALSLPPADDQGAAASSYRDLVGATLPTITVHRTFVVAVVAGRSRAPAVLRREVRLLEGQLRAAGLVPGPPLDRSQLSGLLLSAHRDRGAMGRRASRSNQAWPLAVDDRWAMVRADGSWHCTYWVADWPGVEVGPDFLTPLMAGVERGSFSVLMQPVPPDVALRQARSSQASDLADEQLRAKAGFLRSSRRERESEGARQREEELASGHNEFRFSAYLTVSADDREGLVAACAEAEHAATSARLELQRLYGRQAEALTWTQPLGRGMR